MIKVDLLPKHMHHVPKLAAMWQKALGHSWLPNTSIEEIESFMYEWDNCSSLPLAHIALDGQKPIGICGLVKNDGVRPDLWPWLCDLVVCASYQGKGVGKALIIATKNKAKELGFRKIYLFVFDNALMSYYQNFGFSAIGQEIHQQLPITIMCANL